MQKNNLNKKALFNVCWYVLRWTVVILYSSVMSQSLFIYLMFHWLTRKHTERERIYASYIPDRGWIASIYKELKKQRAKKKKKNKQCIFLKWAIDLTWFFFHISQSYPTRFIDYLIKCPTVTRRLLKSFWSEKLKSLQSHYSYCNCPCFLHSRCWKQVCLTEDSLHSGHSAQNIWVGSGLEALFLRGFLQNSTTDKSSERWFCGASMHQTTVELLPWRLVILVL